MSNKPAAKQRVLIDEESWSVYLDGVRYEVEHPLALQLFKCIAMARGQIVSHKDLSQIPGGRNGNVRFDRIINHLPRKIRNLIVSLPGRCGGYALKLPRKK